MPIDLEDPAAVFRKAPPLHVTLLLAPLVLVAIAPVSLAGKSKGQSSCNRNRGCDTQPPGVSIADPTAGDAISGLTSVNGSAADNGEIIEVKVNIDAATAQTADGTASWTADLDTTAYANGSHLITVTATDMAGNVGAASVEVMVSNEPSPPPPEEPPPPPPPPEEPPPPPPQTTVEAPPLSPGAIGGYVFKETDRDGIYETDEQPLASQNLFLFDSTGTYRGNTYSDASGWYQFAGVADGTYRVEFAPAAWWAIRENWVPDTTATLVPERVIQLASTTRADFGWRPIVRSSDASSPMSSYIGPNGLRVQSYDDVVAANEIYDRLMSGSLNGPEARFVTIRFDYAKTGSTSTMAARSNDGPYDTYEATSNVSYLAWLDGDSELFHEYGHAWSLYYAYIVQQDPSLSTYLAARGLLGDPRVNSSYGWNVREMIAEDYRQLFGTASAQSASQLNHEIRPASDVLGLREFLAGAFMQPAAP